MEIKERGMRDYLKRLFNTKHIKKCEILYIFYSLYVDILMTLEKKKRT